MILSTFSSWIYNWQSTEK